MSSNHVKAVNRYQERAGKQYHLWLHSKNDSDVIAQLDSQKNKQGYIKALIRADMAKGDGE